MFKFFYNSVTCYRQGLLAVLVFEEVAIRRLYPCHLLHPGLVEVESLLVWSPAAVDMLWLVVLFGLSC